MNRLRIGAIPGVVLLLSMGCGDSEGESATGGGGATTASATGSSTSTAAGNTSTTGTGGGDGPAGTAASTVTTSGDGSGGTGGAGNTGGGPGAGGNTGSGGGIGDAVADDFERSVLGPNWGIVFPQPPNDTQVAIVDDSDLGLLPGPQGFFIANWRGTSFAADQFSEATIPLDVTHNWIHQVTVRWRSADAARYGFGYGSDPNQVDQFETWYFKYDGVPGPETRWIATTPATEAPAPGDTLRIEIEGFTLRGYWNGALVLEATDEDESRIEDGEAGVAARWALGNQPTQAAAKVWESWAGGSL